MDQVTKQDFEKLVNVIGTLSKTVTKTDEKVSNLSTALAKTDEKVSNLSTALAKTDEKVSNLSKSVTKLSKEVSTTNKKFTALTKQIDRRFEFQTELLEQHLEIQLEETLKTLRSENQKYKDEIISEIVELRQETSVNSSHRLPLTDHEQRISKVERHVFAN